MDVNAIEDIGEWVDRVEPQGWVWARAECFDCGEVHCFRRIVISGGSMQKFCLPCADRFEREQPTSFYVGMFR